MLDSQPSPPRSRVHLGTPPCTPRAPGRAHVYTFQTLTLAHVGPSCRPRRGGNDWWTRQPARVAQEGDERHRPRHNDDQVSKQYTKRITQPLVFDRVDPRERPNVPALAWLDVTLRLHIAHTQHSSACAHIHPRKLFDGALAVYGQDRKRAPRIYNKWDSNGREGIYLSSES